jgi:hypothetical protein
LIQRRAQRNSAEKPSKLRLIEYTREVMIKEIRCNQETKQEGEEAKKTLEDLSSRRMA